MKLTKIAMGVAATIVLAPSAFAQTPEPAPAAPPAANTPPAAASVSDADIQKYASAVVAVNKVQTDTSVA